MLFKKIGRALLFPHIAVLILLLPSVAAIFIYSLTIPNDTSLVRIAAYTLSFYTLTVWCIGFPNIIRFFKNIKNENKYIKIWFSDTRLRMNVTLCGNVLWNGAYAALQLGLGIYHSSVWFYSLSAYYAFLAVMRFFIVHHTLRHIPCSRMHSELKRYRVCGWILLFMNTALSGMMFYMIKGNGDMRHHEIITIAMATYTFTTLTFAIIGVIKYRKYNSPAMSAAKVISLTAVCVSMLTLENTMLNTFGNVDITPFKRSLFLSFSGGAVSVFIIVTAIYMIVASNKKIKMLGEMENGK